MVTFTPEFKKQEELKSQMSLTPVELQRRFDLTSTPIVSNPASAPSITPASSITQNQYQYQPGENTEQYNARIAALRGETPTPAIGTSATIRNDELKKQADQIKADNEKAAELKRVATQAEIDRIKSGVLPGGTKPAAPSLTVKFEELRTAGGIPAIETELTAVRNEKQTIIDELNKYKRDLSGIAGGTQSIFAGKEGEAARIAQDRLDVLNRQESLVVDKLNSKNKYIETVMNLTGKDYDNARQAYNDEYDKNLKIQDIYNKNADESQKDAQAYLTSVTNLISNSGKSWNDIDEGMKADIHNYELKAGYPVGTLETFARSKPKANVIGQTTGYDANGNQVLSIISSDADGNPSITQIKTGAVKAPKTGVANQFQTMSAGYAQRMINASDIFTKVESDITKASVADLTYYRELPTWLNFMLPSWFQQQAQAERDFINAKLRQESGAQINPEEFISARMQYFPQPGDKPEVLENKKRNRETVTRSMAEAGASAFTGDMPGEVSTPGLRQKVIDAGYDYDQMKSDGNSDQDIINALE